MEQWLSDTERGEQKYLKKKTRHGATVSTANLTWTDVGSNPEHRVENMATNRLEIKACNSSI
jgi:hypothetical protein